MDQDSFRQLLTGSSTTARAASSAAPIRTAKTSKNAKAKSNKPANDTTNSDSGFKPRKLKQLESKYRDRAAERREGTSMDYDQVESILEDMERRNAPTAAPANDEDDDDMLEQAFEHAPVPAKRTRADILRELKEKRVNSTQDVEASSSSLPAEEQKKEARIDDLKQTGKFKPIGFQPIGGDKTKKRKVKEAKEGEERKKKKKKKEVEGTVKTDAEPATSALKQPPPAPEPEPEVDDIFADVEEYQGLELDDEDDADSVGAGEEGEVVPHPHEEPLIPTGRPRWFDEEDPDLAKSPSPPPASLPTKLSPEPERAQKAGEPEDEDMEGEERPMRLQPLHSSSVPSIKDLLAMSGSGSGKRRKGKKGKKKGDEEEEGKPKASTEAKVERDYKRLKNYTDKRGEQ